MASFFGELKRRNVYRVAAAYAVVAWLLIQLASILFPTFEAPGWVMKVFVAAVVLGFPIALIFAWAFELTPEGLKRTEDVPPEQSVARSAGRKLDFAIIGVLAFAVALLLFARYRTGAQPAGSPSSDKSIAVLPFQNLSRDPDNAFFAEGVQEEILARLAKVADLKVISRTSTQRFKSAPENLPQIAKQLGVKHILEGSVQRSGDQVRVSVQLINATTDAHLWADIYDRRLTDIFAVESEIAKAIADTLQAKLSGSEKSRIAMQPTSDTAAHDFYLRGRVLWGRRSGDNLPRAIALYEQAIARDPNYALAYAGLAEAYVLLPGFTPTPPRDTNARAKTAAIKALQLDEQLAEAHSALAQVLYNEFDFRGAATEFQRAISLNPNYATAHHWYGNGPLVSLARFDEAIAEGKRAIELDPLSPIINADQGVNLILARRYDDAIAQLEKTLEIDPSFHYACWNLALALQLKGDLTRAIAEYEKAEQLSDDLHVRVLLANAKAQAGNKDEPAQMLREVEQLSAHRNVRAYSRALLCIFLGDHSEAIRWLRTNYAEPAGGDLGWIKVDPLLDPLRGDSRFEALMQQVLGKQSSL